MTQASVGPPSVAPPPSAPVPVPDVPPGWYPDPSQVGTQRYWDGRIWTDQMAPLAPMVAPSSSFAAFEVAPVVMALIGAVLAIAGAFLPAADSAAVLGITDNSLIEKGDGIFMALLGAVGGIAAYAGRYGEGRNLIPLVCGIILLGLAYYAGTSIELVNGLGKPITGDPGVGIYAVGAGGIFMVIAGVLSRDG